MRGTLELGGVILRLKLGKLPVEKISPRDVPVDISWTGSTSRMPGIDYSEVCQCLAVLQEREYDFIEELATGILDLLRRRYPSGIWKVKVRKPFPPAALKMEMASFTVEGGDNG